MNATSPLLIPKLVSALAFTFVLVVLYIWVKRLLIILLCLGRRAWPKVTPNRRVTENKGSVEDDRADRASPSKMASVGSRSFSSQARRGTHLPNGQNGSLNQPPSSPNSTPTLTRHFGWPLEPVRIEHDPSNQDAGGLVEESGIHLQLYINAARTIITGANFSSVTNTGEPADAANAN
ncbi:hypothetical protein BJ165DRAFT_1522780 [Panaeolus papilionaceus]|nr:hypothetical protein BJ165DRAFT_1522780 [Panaeolus papilionaceus]